MKDDFYNTCANLSGQGFSLQESITAVVLVGNGMFGRSWRRFEDESETFSLNTAPERINVLDKLRQVEAKSLGLVVEAVMAGKEQGQMITHASDSTTKRETGSFIGQVCNDFNPPCTFYNMYIRAFTLVKGQHCHCLSFPSVVRPEKMWQHSLAWGWKFSLL